MPITRAMPARKSILTRLQRQDPNATLNEAQAINRDLGLELESRYWRCNRSTACLRSRARIIGNNFEVGHDWELGFGIGASYRTDWRQTTRKP